MEIKPWAKNVASTLLLLIGLGGMASAGWVLKSPLQEESANVIQSKAMKSCKSLGKEFGYSSKGKQKIVSFESPGLANWEKDLSVFSMIMLKCDGYKLEQFCMGTSCKGNNNQIIYGTFMKLKYLGK